MKRLLLLLVLGSALRCAAADETLYAVSMRTYSDPSYHGVEGNLYTVSTDTGVTRLLAPLTIEGKTPIGLDGLAIHPRTGAFYGITPTGSPVIPHSLVSLDPNTGYAKLIGDLGVEGTDIDFDPDGTLYMWVPATRQLATVDIATGRATPRGSGFSQAALKGGIALIGGGRAYVATGGGKGTLDMVDLPTGTVTTGPPLTGAPFEELMNGLTYSPRGVLYGINSNGANPPLANLVRINAATGKVTNVGALPNETDALSFGKGIGERDIAATLVQEWRLPLLVVLFLVAVVIIVVATRTRKG